MADPFIAASGPDRGTLAQIGHVESLVITEEADLRVGEVRTRLITTAHEHPAPMSSDAWIFSTDADTIVPESWITEILTEAHRTQADLVLGLAGLMDWDVDDQTRASYERIITAGMTNTGHTHAANLALTWQAVGSSAGSLQWSTAKSTPWPHACVSPDPP